MTNQNLVHYHLSPQHHYQQQQQHHHHRQHMAFSSSPPIVSQRQILASPGATIGQSQFIERSTSALPRPESQQCLNELVQPQFQYSFKNQPQPQAQPLQHQHQHQHHQQQLQLQLQLQSQLSHINLSDQSVTGHQSRTQVQQLRSRVNSLSAATCCVTPPQAPNVGCLAPPACTCALLPFNGSQQHSIRCSSFAPSSTASSSDLFSASSSSASYDGNSPQYQLSPQHQLESCCSPSATSQRQAYLEEVQFFEQPAYGHVEQQSQLQHQPQLQDLAETQAQSPQSPQSQLRGFEFGQQQQQLLPFDEQSQSQPQSQPQPFALSPGAGQCQPLRPSSSSPISASDALNLGINLEQYISKRNERERSRVRHVNDAFENLKNSLPLEVDKMSKRMSKVEILRSAISYIRNLEGLLERRKVGCD